MKRRGGATSSPDKRIRGRKGQKMRERRLKRTNGLCERCLAARRVRVATRVDHIVPLVLGGEDVDENTRNLCEPCHLEVTAEQFGHAEPVAARGIDASGRPASADHAWNTPAGAGSAAPPARSPRRPVAGGGGSKV